jgi:hypothetical protein
MTYLELVNDVLIRLREDEVSNVSENAYSKLIGKFVNDSKRQVEDAYNWNALADTLTFTTTANLFNAVLVGSGQRFRVLDVLNDTSDWFVDYMPTSEMNRRLLLQGTTPTGAPTHYNFNGVDENGDTQVDVYPVPDGVYNLRFNIIKPQPAMTSNTERLLVPSEPVVFGAYARALAERGEDSGILSSEAYALFQQSLADAIANEGNRYPEELIWNT